MESKKNENLQVVGDSVTINHIQSSDKDESKAKKWLVPLVTTLIGIVATIIVAWYQLKVGEEQAFQAAIEREKAVIQNIVKIVEEHVINNNELDIPRLARLIDLRSREEKLRTKISTLQVIQKAEFNIINSAYLEFDKKNEYKKIFDNIYSQLSFDGLEGYDGLHANVANELAKSIKSGDTQTSITTLNSLLDLLNKDVSDAKKENSPELLSILRIFDKDFLFMLTGVQALLMLFLMYFRVMVRRRREINLLKRKEYEKYYASKLSDEL
ncbi:hypothetical protein [Vibrio coralliilyticus]|uniref:hypothetical protein n=1 Tax=Vibrio coralliilyticus TaxID=190893 RepID=UPI0015615733|nr:hypothetical protein [Vibrio coralliilyticus]NRF17544.1 hypothetical protein [Vibrio coralliilyticus]